MEPVERVSRHFQEELEQLKITVGLTADDERYLRLAGEVLTGQTRAVVLHWRSQIIASLGSAGTPRPSR